MLRIAAATFAVIGLAGTPFGQTQSSLKFEVASLKPSPPGGRGGGVRPAPGGERYVATNCPLRLLITVAYRIKDNQLSGAPDWINTETYDMNAKAEKPSSVEDLHSMLQNLLAERFKLQFHHETKELPVYVLTVDKSGPKMQPHKAENAGEPWIDLTVDQLVHVKMAAKVVPMDYFAWRLGLQNMDRPVIDRTNLKGGYDFNLSFTRELPPGLHDGAQINGAPIDTSGPTIFEAMRQQLGLKLEPRKGPVEIMVIDRVEKPAVN